MPKVRDGQRSRNEKEKQEKKKGEKKGEKDEGIGCAVFVPCD